MDFIGRSVIFTEIQAPNSQIEHTSRGMQVRQNPHPCPNRHAPLYNRCNYLMKIRIGKNYVMGRKEFVFGGITHVKVESMRIRK